MESVTNDPHDIRIPVAKLLRGDIRKNSRERSAPRETCNELVATNFTRDASM